MAAGPSCAFPSAHSAAALLQIVIIPCSQAAHRAPHMSVPQHMGHGHSLACRMRNYPPKALKQNH